MVFMVPVHKHQVDQTAVSLEVRQAQEVLSCKGKMKISVAVLTKFLL